MKHSPFTFWGATRLLICALCTSMFSVTAVAHTPLAKSTPADGAIIKQAPAHISLTFKGPIKLVKLKLMGVGHEMPTNFKTNSEAKSSFVIETPGMHPGEFTVNWAIIGEDGHTVSDSYSFTVDPSAAE